MNQREREFSTPFTPITEPVTRSDGAEFCFVRYESGIVALRERREGELTRWSYIDSHTVDVLGEGDFSVALAKVGQLEYEGKW